MAGRPRSAATGRPVRGTTWWVAFVAIVALLTAVGWFLATRPPAGDRPAEPAASPTPTPEIPEIARQEVWTSDTQPSGEYVVNTVTAEPAIAAPETVRYVLKVETSTEVDADEAARTVQATLDDERGWVGYGKRNFALVTDEASADMVVHIVAPATVDELCKPLETEAKWNCRVEKNVVLNSDRWRYMTPTYDDLAVYRSYMVNHEVGHFLGQGDVTCKTPGAPAPVMVQQSIDLGGCTPNPWPKLAD